MTDAPRKPFWKRKRWIAAAVLWLVIAYPLGLSAIAYLDGWGWLPSSWYPTIQTAYAPLFSEGRVRPTLQPWFDWCYELGRRHSVSN
jgi:hypothetical protein